MGGMNDKAISRELGITYWVARRLLAEVTGNMEADLGNEPKEIKLPVWIKIINWDLFMPYAMTVATNPHTTPEDRERVETMLKEVASFLQSL